MAIGQVGPSGQGGGGGTSGYSGVSGFSGFSGVGTSGYSGYSGVSGYSGPNLSGLTTNTLVKATGASSIGNSSITDNGTTVAVSEPVTPTANGAASTPPVKLTGTWFTGGSATTTKPQLLIEPTGTTSTNWNTSGTGLGINASSGFGGYLVDFQQDGAGIFMVSTAGTVQAGNNNTTTGVFQTYSGFRSLAFGAYYGVLGSTQMVVNNGNLTFNSADLLMGSDNANDIGASGASRPRTLYLGTSVVSPAATLSSATVPITFSNAAFQGCTSLGTSAGGVLTCTVSDGRLKNIGEPFVDGLDAISKITPRHFTWKDGRREGEFAGLIAQDVQSAIPLAVSAFGEDQTLQLEKDALLAALINSVKELKTRVETLEAENVQLKKKP